MYRDKKRSSIGLYIFLLVIVGIFAAMYFLQNDPRFEKVKPVIKMQDSVYWNPKKGLEIEITDNFGLKSVEASFYDGENEVKLADVGLNGDKKYLLKVNFPKSGILAKNNILKLTVIAKDKSLWGMLRGNKTVKKAIVHIDKERPSVLVVANSYGISKGGSAVVIFRVRDKNLKKVYITTNFGKKFIPNPFYKKDYYISLIAWPIFQKSFTAWVVAEDKAGNKTKQRVALYLKNRKYKVSYINAKDSFIDGKIAQLAEDKPEETAKLNRLQKLKYVNETYRIANEDLIRKVTTPVDNTKIVDFKINKFYPLRNGKVVGTFGDHRYYYYKTKDNIVSESYHMGIDFASVREADIVSSNRGLTVFAKYNGIYGNNLIIYHGLGLYSLYGHCSQFLTDKGEIVKAKQVVAQTGMTGLALGDHLHFGLMVQGVMVRPQEWMDSRWIKANITDVIKKAKEMID
jgi:murein DD-endopeptidase MepM/ murein hydrolase activator NlpD